MYRNGITKKLALVIKNLMQISCFYDLIRIFVKIYLPDEQQFISKLLCSTYS